MVWKNQNIMKGVTAEEKLFVWTTTQDMLEVGNRIHRKNAQIACQRLKRSGEKCEEIEDMYHCLSECEVVEESVKELELILEEVIEREVMIKEIANAHEVSEANEW